MYGIIYIGDEGERTNHFQNIPVGEIIHTGKIPLYGIRSSHFESYYMKKFFRILVGLYGKIF